MEHVDAELWRTLRRPNARKFRQALLNRGLPAPSEAVLQEHLLKYQSSKQIFAPSPKYRGLIYSTGLDAKWACDVMVQTQNPSEYKGEKWQYALIVQDIFSRFAWAELIKSPMEAAEGLRRVIERAGKAPQQLVCDADPGFQTAAFKQLLEERHIEQTLRVGRNDLATVDRLISTLKRALAVDAHESGSDDWAPKLQHVIALHNQSPNDTLLGGEPQDLRDPEDNKVLYFLREEREAENIQHNDRLIHARIPRLQREGAFRVWLKKDTRLRGRIFNPQWSTEIHRLASERGAYATDDKGDEYPTKEILPVPLESTQLVAPAARLNAKARQMLQRYADRGRAFLMGQPERRANATRFYNALAAIGDVKEALRLAGVASDAVVRSIITVFPDTFRLETSKKGGAAFVTLAP